MLINAKSIKQLLPFVGAWLFKWSLAIWRLWLCSKWNIWCYSCTNSWCSSWCHHFDTKNLWWGREVLSRDLVATDLYDKWFRHNIIHDVDMGMVTIFIDGVQNFQAKDKGPGDLYFKCGVYAAPTNISYDMESRWRDIKINNH